MHHAPHAHRGSRAEAWEPYAHEAARHLHRLARAAGRRHRRGWPPFGPEDFGGFQWGGPGWGRFGRRAARGDIRAAILMLLAEKPSHGYQIIQELESRSEGAWRVSPGSVYPTLQQLEDEGLVRTVASETERRVYELSDAGRAEADKLAGAGTAPWDDAAGGVATDVVELVDLIKGIGFASWQAVHSEGGAQAAKAKEILREARKRLYMLLAEERPSPSEKTEE